MALFHFNMKVIKRSSGHTAINAAAYISGSRLVDHVHGTVADFSRKKGVVEKVILTPNGAPAWCHGRETLWNAVERCEGRSDAQLAREMVVALPVELNHQQQVQLIRDYVQAQFVDQDAIADICVHRDNPTNPHAHVLITMRPLIGQDFGLKRRAWNKKSQIFQWREAWAGAVNAAMVAAGQAARVDHRSYAAQGKPKKPTKHLGRKVMHALKTRYKKYRNVQHNEAVLQANNHLQFPGQHQPGLFAANHDQTAALLNAENQDSTQDKNSA